MASAVGGPKLLSRLEHKAARQDLAFSRSPSLLPLKSAAPFLLSRFPRSPFRGRLFTVAAQDSNSRQQQKQELNVSVLRFTFGIPGLDESYLPRYIGIAVGALIVLNHAFSASTATPAQLTTEALGICLAAFSIVLPYLGRFLEGANAVDRTSLPEGNRQIFLMSNDISDALKEDLAWASYVLLRNTNSMSVIIAINNALCVRGYWSTPEDDSRDYLLKWFFDQIQQTGFSNLSDTLYFPQSPDPQLDVLLPKGTLSMLVQPVIRTNFSMDNEGIVLLASNIRYGYAEKDRAWIRAVANKFSTVNKITDIQGFVTSR